MRGYRSTVFELLERGPGPHRHLYDEVQFVREARGLWNVSGDLSSRFIQEDLP